MDKINRNIKKIEKWFNEPGITESRKKALEENMTQQLTIKATLEKARNDH